ncbi:uncharacterized protein LOC111355679 [Spodoptera litura]|uniref:Uncharacterized protein LOC111355679 n=1 Tax=Spodoptera litura TaxID=69820 RepID=A0A9J7E913_SPOLT|nr:uncharacterized protein LOC111355679 [Spodoptera litura]
MKRLSASQEKRIQQLLCHEELGDRKPSQFLRHLQSLAGPSGATDFVKSIWTNRLPQNIQTVIASQITELQVEQLANIADRVYEIAPTTPQVASTSTRASDTDLARTVTELTKQVAALTLQMNRRGRDHSRSRSRYHRSAHRRYDRSNSRLRQPPPNHPHCFYHYTYGDKAKNCKEPCTYKSENSKGGRK